MTALGSGSCNSLGSVSNMFPVRRKSILVYPVLLLLLFINNALAQTPAAPTCKGPVELERAIARQPSAAAYDALGAYFGEHKKLGCAIKAFESAVHTDPKSSEAHYDLALALLERGAAARAEEELKASIKLDSSLAQTHTALGLAFNQLGKRDEAVREFEIALKLDPKSIPAMDGSSFSSDSPSGSS